MLKTSNLYWEIYDPYEDEKPVCGSLADDFADIYRDLTAGIVLYQRASRESVQEAVWQWKFGFETHWGRHAVDSLRALHCVIEGSGPFF